MEIKATEATLAPGTVVAGYEVAERIGVGGFGEVYRARHSVLGREVAIKVLHRRYSHDPAAIARFVAEARAASKISHPGIVEVFDFGTLGDGRQFFVMELVSGTTLREVLRDRERLSVDDALPMLSGIAEAIDAAHRAGIAHRDLKPDNIFVLADGSVKVIDFGLAKLVDATDAPVTETGSVLGTPLYMSPEQCRGSGSDTRSDTYSFGVIAYQMVTGEPPFSGDALALALHHLNDDPDPPSQRRAELPIRVDRALLAALAKDPAERPSTLTAIVEALAGGALLPAVTRSGRRRRRRTVVLAGVAAIGLAGFAVAMTAQTRQPEVFEEPCGAGVLRLTGVWDAPRRAAVGARFAKIQRPEVAGTWHAASGELDAYAKQWAIQWNQACRETDPINADGLRPKRISCLNDALANLQGIAELLATADVTALSRGWATPFVETDLEDCMRREMLQIFQLETPIANRSRAAELIPEVYRAYGATRLSTNVGQPASPELISTLDQLATKLDSLHSYAATVALIDLAATEASGNYPAAKQTTERVITRAETTKDDISIGVAYGILGTIALNLGLLDEAETALGRGDVAFARTHFEFLAYARSRLFSLRGKPDMALQALDDTKAKPHDALDDAAHVELLSRTGRDRDAISEARQIVTSQIEHFGELHLRTSFAHFVLAKALARSGDLEAANAELERALDIGHRVDMPAAIFPQMRLLQVSLAARLGRDVTPAAIALLRGESGSTASLSEQDWIGLARRAYSTGAVEVARDAISRLPASSVKMDALAFLDLGFGDYPTMQQRALGVAPGYSLPALRNDPAWIFFSEFSPWLLAIADGFAGRPHEAEARLARLAPAHATSSDSMRAAYALDGVVLIALRRWGDAIDSFEHARALWHADPSDWARSMRLKVTPASRTAIRAPRSLRWRHRSDCSRRAVTVFISRRRWPRFRWRVRCGRSEIARARGCLPSKHAITTRASVGFETRIAQLRSSGSPSTSCPRARPRIHRRWSI